MCLALWLLYRTHTYLSFISSDYQTISYAASVDWLSPSPSNKLPMEDDVTFSHATITHSIRRRVKKVWLHIIFLILDMIFIHAHILKLTYTDLYMDRTHMYRNTFSCAQPEKNNTLKHKMHAYVCMHTHNYIYTLICSHTIHSHTDLLHCLSNRRVCLST